MPFFRLGKRRNVSARSRSLQRSIRGAASAIEGEAVLLGLFPTLSDRFGVSAHWRAIRATPHQSGPSQEGDSRWMPQSLCIFPTRRGGPEPKVMSCRSGRVVKVDDVFCFVKQLGKGGFSEVWLARHQKKPKEEPVAIKLMPKKTADYKFVANEIAVLKITHNCPFIVQMASTFRTPNYYAIVMKCATGGTLSDRVRMVRCFSELIARFYAAEIAEGLFGLHERGIIHRDLNLHNVLISDDGHVMLSDFGLSLLRDVDEIENMCEPWVDVDVGKAVIPAPELLLGLEYDKTVDWWSFGIILYRMVCGEYPFLKRHKKGAELKDYSLEAIYKKEFYPNYLSPHVRSLISQLLCRRKGNRLGRGKLEENDVTSTEFFFNVDWSMLRDHAMPAPFHDLVQHLGSHRSKRQVQLLPTSNPITLSTGHDSQTRETFKSTDRILKKSLAGRLSTVL